MPNKSVCGVKATKRGLKGYEAGLLRMKAACIGAAHSQSFGRNFAVMGNCATFACINGNLVDEGTS